MVHHIFGSEIWLKITKEICWRQAQTVNMGSYFNNKGDPLSILYTLRPAGLFS